MTSPRREILRQELRQGGLRDLLGALPYRFDRPALPPAEQNDGQNREQTRQARGDQPADRTALRHRLWGHHRLEVRQTGCSFPELRGDRDLQRICLDQARLISPFRIRAFVREFDRHRADQVLTGVSRLQLIVETAHVPTTRFERPLAVVANQEVSHGLSESRRFDLDVRLGFDPDIHFHEIR